MKIKFTNKSLIIVNHEIYAEIEATKPNNCKYLCYRVLYNWKDVILIEILFKVVS